MSETQTRKLAVDLPDSLIRLSKADAAIRGITIRQWWTEAGEARLPNTPPPEDPKDPSI